MRTVLMTCLVFVCYASAEEKPAAGKVLSNPGFEQEKAGQPPPGWTLERDEGHGHQKTLAVCAVTDKVACDGKQSVAITNLVRDPLGPKDPFYVARLCGAYFVPDKAKTYEASAKVKVPAQFSGAQVFLRVLAMDERSASSAMCEEAFEKDAGDGWLFVAITAERWKEWAERASRRWSKVRLEIVVKITQDQAKEATVYVDDVFFGPTG
jgi:hypothetical protein